LYNNPGYVYGTGKGEAKDVVLKAGKFGYYCLNSNDGKTVWSTEKIEDPYIVFDPITADNKLIGSDGRKIYCFEFSPTSKGLKWSIDLKKEKLGEISSEKSMIVRETAHKVSSSISYSTVTRTYQWTPRLHGLTLLPDNSILVKSEEGFAKLSFDGKLKWKAEWDWEPKSIYIDPIVYNDGKKMLYQFKKKIYCYDLNEGKVLWINKGKKDAKMIFNPDSKMMYLFNNDSFSTIKTD
jgi:outer membrane protein assembly factor BamB